MLRGLPFCAVLMLVAAAMSAAAVVSAAADQDPWGLPALTAAPEAVLRAASAAPAPAEADIEMLFEEHSFTFDAEGRRHSSVRRVFRFLTDKGVDDWSYTEADWSPWCEERPVIRARVITPDGQAHSLDPESIGEAPVEQDSPNLLSDQKLFRAPLPAIQVGAVAEEEIVTRETRPLFDHGTVERVSLADSHPIRRLRLVIDYPDSLPLRYEVLAAEVKPVRSQGAGRVTLRFETGPVPAKELAESCLPPELSQWPQVVFSTSKSWADMAAGYAAAVESQLDLEAVRPLVRQAVGQESDRDKIVARLLASLRGQVRYSGVEFGKAAIVPRAPRETLARRYGDCKDQATLLVAMLRAVGIRADVALLRAGRASDVVPGLPGMGDFDHAIVYLPGAPPLWIDPSARCVPVGQLPLTDQERWAMVARADTRELIRTPRLDYRQNTSDETVDIFLAERGKARLRASVVCSGSCDHELREDYASQSNKELRKLWRDFFKSQYHTQSLGRLEYSAPLDLSKPFRVVAEVSEARMGHFQETETTVTIQPDPLFDRMPGLFRGDESEKEEHSGLPVSQAQPGERRHPLLLPEAHVRQLRFRLTLPPGYVPRALPPDVVRQCGPATISQHFEQAEDNVVVAAFRLDTGPGRFTAAEVNALQEAIAELGAADDKPWEVKIVLDNVAAQHLATGRTKEALAECRRLIDKHPDTPEPHQRYAQVLLKLGLGEAARQESRRAVELAPKSAAAQAGLARTLTYDSLGRHFSPGMDWPAAAEAYRKALELEPADATTRMDYAILLEHDEEGVRYSPQADLEQAVAEYRKAQKQLGPHNRIDQLDVNLAIVLLGLERYAELEKLAQRPEMSATWKALLVAAVAAERGLAEARRRASELGPGGDERRSVLESAGEYLEDARLYGPAAALLEAAAAGSPDAAALRRRAALLAPMRRFSDASLASDAPRRLVQQLFLALLEGGKRQKQLPELFVSTACKDDVAAVVDALRQALRGTIENQRDNQVPPRRTADVLSQLEITSWGDPAAGYKLCVNDDDLKELAFYAVPERELSAVSGQRSAVSDQRSASAAEAQGTKGRGPVSSDENGDSPRQRLLPPGPGGANLGAMALESLARGDSPGAKRWLDWAAEALPPHAGLSDPRADPPFRHLLKAVASAGPDRLKLAAAALTAQARDPRPAIAILAAAQANHPSPAETIEIDRALAGAYRAADQPARAIEAADRLLRTSERPKGTVPFSPVRGGQADENRDRPREWQEALCCKMTALADLGRSDELRQLLHTQLQETGNDPRTSELLALEAMRLGDFKSARQRLCGLAGSEKVSPLVFNHRAWLAVAEGNVDQQAIDDALTAAKRTAYENPVCLRTLAAVYAEAGKTAEALENLRRGVRLGGDQARDLDWYVLGRIAEQYGLDDVAAGLFRKVPRPKREAADDAYTLAQRQLKKLGK